MNDQLVSGLGSRHQWTEAPAPGLESIRVGAEAEEEFDEMDVPVDDGEKEGGIAVVIGQSQPTLLETCQSMLRSRKMWRKFG